MVIDYRLYLLSCTQFPTKAANPDPYNKMAGDSEQNHVNLQSNRGVQS